MSPKIQAVSQSCLLLSYLTVSYSFKSKRCRGPYRSDYNACLLSWCLYEWYSLSVDGALTTACIFIRTKLVKQEINKC